MAHYLTEPIDVNGGGGGGVGIPEVTQGEHFTTANNLSGESVGAFILRARPASIVANISNVFITNKGVSAVTITEDTRTQVLDVGNTMILGTGARKINNLNTITLGAINSFTIMWSELDA